MTEEKREILKKLEVGTTYSGVDVICRQYKEIERLNNIINELRKYIGNEYYCFDNESLEFKIAKDILNKLQELKGSE